MHRFAAEVMCRALLAERVWECLAERCWSILAATLTSRANPGMMPRWRLLLLTLTREETGEEAGKGPLLFARGVAF